MKHLSFAALLLTLACHRADPEVATAPRSAPSYAALAARAGGVASSLDEAGVARFVWGTKAIPLPATDEPAVAARQHLTRFAPALGLGGAALGAVELEVRSLPRVGVVARGRQKYGALEVYPSEVRILMRDDLSLVALSGALSPAGVKAPRFDLSAEAALAIALSDATGALVTAAVMAPVQVNEEIRFAARTDELHLPEPARAKRVLFAAKGTLTPAYFVEAYAGRPEEVDSLAFSRVIDANSGAVLERTDLTSADAYAYRVYADPADLRPLDGPHLDFSPHPTGMPDGTPLTPNPPNLVTVESFNTPIGTGPDRWLPDGATEALGNNVDAYADIASPTGFSAGDLRATTTAANVFDRTFDLAQAPNAGDPQIMAAVTNIFYTINWLHDYWYDSGFDELGRNAQANNYGRGGLGGDRLLAEIQDFSGRNNANMSTPSDGMSPRMQVFVWNGQQELALTLVGAPSPTDIGTASFGPQNFDVMGQVIAGDDGVGTGSDACEPIMNNVAGRIVLVDRGACSFASKVQNAENAGAVGVILANNNTGGAPGMGGTGNTNIPVLSITQADGATLRSQLLVGPVTATLHRFNGPDVDGALDVGLVSHEWGHYLHRRLTSCGGSSQCDAMSEGWGDTIDAFTKIREGDDLMGAYGHSIFASSGRATGTYFGTRRTAYSINPAIDSLSFRHIQDGEPDPTGQPFDPGGPNSEIHNAGEVWASMMFEVYAELLTQVGPTTPFDEVRRRFADYVVAGLMLTPRGATYLEGRDAILAAAAASTTNPQDVSAIAAAFGRRGAGTCAEGPAASSDDFVGVVEDFSARARIVVGAIAIDDGLYSCDGDGILDAEERGRVTFTVSNGGPVAMTGGTVTVSSTTAGVTFPSGATLNLPALDPYASTTIEVPVDLDPALTGRGSLTLITTVAVPDTCSLSRTSTTVTLVNLDSAAGSTSDDVEAPASAWTPTGDQAADIWTRREETLTEHFWLGEDFGGPSDTSLETPPLVVSATAAFVVSWSHRYAFEETTEAFDGGMIEISIDGGRTWNDVATYVDPGYTDVLGTSSNNPLGGRNAYSGQNAAWPAREPFTLDFGTQLAGRTVALRLRIGTDAAVGNYGWELDDFVVQGITNAPFTSLFDDATTCLPELVADAGPDLALDAFALGLLDGSGSGSNAGRAVTYAWAQTAGPNVALSRADTPLAGFVAPNLRQETTLTFELTVDDGVLSATDSVDVLVRAGDFTELVAEAGPNRTVAARDVVLLDGSASRGEGTLTYEWSQVDGPTVALLDWDNVVAAFVAPQLDDETELRFQLRVEDDSGSAIDTVTITIGAAEAVVADAGADQSAEGGATVVLDGSGSTGPAPLTLTWTQASGPTVDLGTGEGARLAFVAPDQDATLTFTLTASDGTRMSTDDVAVTVKKKVVATTPTPTDEGGCSCSATSRGGSVGWILLLLPFGLVRRRR